ncbi:hypothetical protein BCR44DRAFT_67955 [Catenaria anguillulae PL171]|uniref:CCHC-type domain-containing protein n=1 Tax=Catenaria anguillulae PL171 TaxID=765915 RepID=A0A1Y2HK77_9FUNG|nr:hypothetical protein BCR44DRAFT_67955 [Catenaria anguillulae PL171]
MNRARALWAGGAGGSKKRPRDASDHAGRDQAVADGPNKKFRGQCYVCGEWGHPAKGCP